MIENKLKKGLGRGLSSLLGDSQKKVETNKVSIKDLSRNKFQPSPRILKSRSITSEKISNAMERIGPSVFNAVMSTFLAVIVLSFSNLPYKNNRAHKLFSDISG